MARKAIIRILDGVVVNVIELDLGSTWTPPPGHETRDALAAAIGDIWDGTQYTRPPHVSTPDELEAQGQPSLIESAVAFRDRTDYLPEPSFANLPALAASASANQTRDYIIANVIPRLNVLSAGSNVAVPRINVNTKALQAIINSLLLMA